MAVGAVWHSTSVGAGVRVVVVALISVARWLMLRPVVLLVVVVE